MTGRVDELVHFGERHDFVELLLNLGFSHAEDRPIQKDVLPAGQLVVESGAHFEQRAHAAANLREATGRFGNFRQNLEQRALAGAVATDDAHDIALLDFE